MAVAYRAEERYYYRRDLKDKGKAIMGGTTTVKCLNGQIDS
jgi:hypothetical protein